MNITEITAEKKESDVILRVAAYCRVSSDSEDQLHSFAAQIRYYMDYVKRHPEYSLVDIYADEGLTGTSMEKRHDMNRLLRDCKKGKIDRIITKSVSRFARNTQELLITLRMLKEIGVSVFFEEQGIDTDKLNMEMIVTFSGMAAQQESETISKNMRWSYKRRMESGEFSTCKPAYGFDLVNGKLEINDKEAVIVRRIYNLYLHGYSQAYIAKLLNAEGIPRKKTNEKWQRRSIFYILNNERYIGDALLQKSFTTETVPYKKVTNRGEKAQYYVENSNPPIVSKKIYEAVQELQKTKNVVSRDKRENHPFARIMRCPDCGRAFRRQTTAGTAYWLCSSRSVGASDCPTRRIREDMVRDTFITMLYKLHDNRAAIFDSTILRLEQMQSRSRGMYEAMHEIDRQIADLSAQNHVLARLHTNGVLNGAEYASQSGEISNKISMLRAERRKKITEDADEELLDELRMLKDIMEEYTPSEEFDEELFSQFVESITVNDSTCLTFRLLGGIELTETISERGWCKTA